ncbi:MBOAT, membrane-bound O-acyltransferase family-domain-containing protein [Boletus edulis]|nr:MBOAT, membrane-bound O-acyltransferase family-domain-containing protein [Boletus edulis]
MNTLVSSLANAFGGSNRLKIIWCLLIAYPVGNLFTRLPSSQPNLKHAFNISTSVVVLIPVLNLQWGFLQLLFDALGTYVIAANFRGSSMPWVVFIFVMSHLTINHVIREAWLSRDTLEISSAQMILAMKLTTFAWNVCDGQRPEEDLDEWQFQKRITKYPTLLAFLGYSFYFPSILYGPNLDYVAYTSLINGTLFNSVEPTEPMQRATPDGRKRAACRKMLEGLVFLSLFTVLSPSYNYTITLTPWFARQSLLYRIAVFQFYGFVERFKFYAIWTLTEGANILTGLGFSGFGPSGESLWEGAMNVKPLEIELPSNFKAVLGSWNINTNIWLREYVYKRVTPKGGKPGFRSTLITCFTSALWHGVAIGYFLVFIPGGLVTYLSRKSRASIRPLVMPPAGVPSTWVKRTYDFLGTVISILLLNFVTAPFRLLTLANTMEAWSRLGWYGCWIVGFGVTFFNAGGPEYLQSLQEKQANIINVKQPRTPSIDLVAALGPAVEEL